MKKATIAVLLLSCLGQPTLVSAGPLPFSDMLMRSAATPREFHMNTSWGYGAKENHYNELIVRSVQAAWTDAENALPPLLYKSLMAVESSFNPQAVSYAGAAGLAQLMPDTARRFGLGERDRLDPNKALPAGIQALEEKHRVIADPGNYYKVVGIQGKVAPWGEKVAAFYEAEGAPQGEDRWALVLGAYNGGGGTILRAMAYAVDRGLDPRKWDHLAGPPGKALNTPLYAACAEVFGARNAARKAAELAAYPRKILGLYHEAGGTGLRAGGAQPSL